MPVRDISRLPQWAQELIKSKDTTIANLESDLAEAIGGQPDSNVFLRVGHGSRKDEQPIGKDRRVRFALGGAHLFDSVVVRVEDGVLDVHGDATLVVVPNSTNHIKVRLER